MKLSTTGKWVVEHPDTGLPHTKTDHERDALVAACNLGRALGRTIRVWSGVTIDVESEAEKPEPVWASPLVIREGGTYIGRWESHEAGVSAVTIDTNEPVILEDSELRGVDHLVSAPWVNANVTLRRVKGTGLTPTVDGAYPGRFVHIEGYKRLEILNCELDGTSGIYANDSAHGAEVRVLFNKARNIDGRRVGGGDPYYAQFFQLNRGHALRHSEVAWNAITNLPYESRVEDVISAYRTEGVSGDPVRIHHNLIDGAYPEDPAKDNYSGGGIMLGDSSGAYLEARENTVIGTVNYGVAISGGHHNIIRGNHVISAGRLPDGTIIPANNVGIYIWDMRDDPNYGQNKGRDNRVAWAHPERDRNDWWTPDAAVWEGNRRINPGAVVTPSMEDAARDAWWATTQDRGLTIGMS